MRPLAMMVVFAGLPVPGSAQTAALPDAPETFKSATASQADLTYTRPTEKENARNYLFDAFGPYPIASAVIEAGINQWSNTPPEWGQGMSGYGSRFGSNFGITAIGVTTRYSLAKALGEDTLYYRCTCQGLMPRFGHAMLSTLTGRRGEDGHRVFSLPSLVAPYAGSMAAVYGWYPGRYGAKDGFRIGNYNLLAYAGSNVVLEFFYSGPHSLLSRMHLNNRHGASAPATNP
ncbi:MAG TPA: hypothetical protein VIY53_17185 [Acidobacteriaceae bacterium]